jgi:hypothetical protein
MKTSHFWNVLLIVVLMTMGCRRTPTDVERDNRRLLDAILTAITIKNANLLEEDAERTESRHKASHLTDEEYQDLEAIINKARKGDWAGAEHDGYEFRKQHPFVMEGQ